MFDVDMILKKNLVDGNIHPLVNGSLNEPSEHVHDTNALMDEMICIFEYSPTENFIVPMSESYISASS